MKIVKLKGGLGNQLFQYAFAKLLERETGDHIYIDMSSYADLNGDMIRRPRIQKFNLSLPVAAEADIKKLCKLNHNGNSQSNLYRLGLVLECVVNKRYLFERNHMGCSIAQMNSHDFFDGYWQDCNIVDSVMKELNHEYVPTEDLSERSKEKLTQIESCNSVFVGIRRGDYLTVRPKHYGVFDQVYYDRAMDIVEKAVNNPVFFLFSNDIKWVQESMNFSGRKVVYITETEDDFEDFVLMTKCKHSIIPNSTYHWWGARRHEYPGKVIVAPEKWFADGAPISILPERWEKI